MAYNNYSPNRSKSRPNQSGSGFNPLRDARQIEQPLSAYYAARLNTFLIDGPVYKTAEEIRKMSSSQLRKVLDLAKEAVTIVRHGEDSFLQAQKQLFTLLPMLAYNYGRASNQEKPAHGALLKFVYETVNENSIQSADDIETFDQLATALVAYHKYLGGK